MSILVVKWNNRQVTTPPPSLTFRHVLNFKFQTVQSWSISATALWIYGILYCYACGAACDKKIGFLGDFAVKLKIFLWKSINPGLKFYRRSVDYTISVRLKNTGKFLRGIDPRNTSPWNSNKIRKSYNYVYFRFISLILQIHFTDFFCIR